MLTISQVTKAFGGRTLFEDASLQVNRGDRVGLVGPNGAGKSTLFSLILDEATPDAGKVSLERSASIGFLPQESAPAGEETCARARDCDLPELSHAQRILKTTPEDSTSITMRCRRSMSTAAGRLNQRRSASCMARVS
jgi:ATP-binding cassette subfamily F protein 3